MDIDEVKSFKQNDEKFELLIDYFQNKKIFKKVVNCSDFQFAISNLPLKNFFNYKKGLFYEEKKNF